MKRFTEFIVCVFVCIHTPCAHRDQKRTFHPLKLESWMVVGRRAVLGTVRRSSAEQQVLSKHAVSLAPKLYTFYLPYLFMCVEVRKQPAGGWCC